MTNSIVSKMVDGQEKGAKQVQSPTRGKGKPFYPNSPPKPKFLEFGGPRHSKVNYRSPRSSPSHHYEIFPGFGDTIEQRFYGRGSPNHKANRCSPSKDRCPRLSPSQSDHLSNHSDFVDAKFFGRGSPFASGKIRNPRLSPSHGELYAGFSDSPEPTALPLPPSHWIFPNFSNLLLDAQA